MPREKHPAASGVFQHIIINAPDGHLLFRDEQDKYSFIRDFRETRESMDVTCISAGLVDTHAHLELMSGPLFSCSRFMHQLMTSYCCKFNLRHERRGHVLRNRHFWLLMDDAHALNTFRYQIVNPLKAGLVRTISHLEHYPFTILPELLGHQPPRFASLEATLFIFGDTVDEARENIRAWIRGGLEDPKVFRAIENLFRRRRALANVITDPIDIDAEFADIVARVCAAANVATAELVGTSKRGSPTVTLARAAVIHLAMSSLALRQVECEKRLSLSSSSVSALKAKGEAAARELGLNLGGDLVIPESLSERLARRRAPAEAA